MEGGEGEGLTTDKLVNCTAVSRDETSSMENWLNGLSADEDIWAGSEGGEEEAKSQGERLRGEEVKEAEAEH